MSKISFVSLAGVFVVGSVAFGQQYEPLEEHKILKKDVGTWNATLKASLDEGQPAEFKAVEVNKMVGDVWVRSEFEGDFFGQKFTGSGIFGYDPEKKKYVGTWVDSTTPYPIHMIGTYDKESDTLTFETKGKNPAGGEMIGKNVMVYKGDDKRIFTMYSKQGEKFVEMMEVTYTRKK